MVNNLSKVPCKIISWNVRSILQENKLSNFLQILDDNDINIACV